MNAAWLLSGALPLVMAASAAMAQEVDLHGYVEAELVGTPADRSWTDGGLGKLRWGGQNGDARVTPELSALLLEGSARLPLDLRASADIRYDPAQKSAIDLIDATLRWQPPADGPWIWTARIGAFFPPFSQENNDIGWSSPWTLTYSALDSWLGEELRTIGGEAGLRWHDDDDQLGLTAALYGWNDPAGVLIAEHGWDIGNRALGLFDHARRPTPPGVPAAYTTEFDELDDTPGWYAQAIWEHQGLGRFELDRYDNEADPSAERDDVYGWRTRFWSLGYARSLGPFHVIAQGLTGSTEIRPDGLGPFITDFYTGYMLVGWTDDPWRAALRLETFGTGRFLQEHGRAVTASLNWQPEDWLRLTAEVVAIDSWRTERLAFGDRPRQIEVEPQLGLRLLF